MMQNMFPAKYEWFVDIILEHFLIGWTSCTRQYHPQYSVVVKTQILSFLILRNVTLQGKNQSPINLLWLDK